MVTFWIYTIVLWVTFAACSDATIMHKLKHHRGTVQIAENHNGKLTFHVDRWATHLAKNWPDHKVAIVAVVGMSGSGKSELLNIIHRYLSTNASMREDSRNWMRCEDQSAVERNCVPPFKTATEHQQSPCTKGVWITTKPYFIDGTAVFLMDTQGIGSNAVDTRADAQILHFAAASASNLIVKKDYPMDRFFKDIFATFIVQLRESADGTLFARNEDANIRPLQNLVYAMQLGSRHMATLNSSSFPPHGKYMEEFWKANPGDYNDNAHKETDRAFATTKDCVLPDIHGTYDQFRDDAVKDERLAFPRCLSDIFETHLQPKTVFGEELNGIQFAERIKQYQKVIHKNNERPFLDIYQYEIQNIARLSVATATTVYRSCQERQAQNLDLANCGEPALLQLKTRCHKEALHKFQEKNHVLKWSPASIFSAENELNGNILQMFDALKMRRELLAKEAEAQSLHQQLQSSPLQQLLNWVLRLGIACLIAAALYITVILISCISGLRARQNKVSSTDPGWTKLP